MSSSTTYRQCVTRAAKSLWDTLEATYKAKSIAHKIALKRQLNMLRKQADEPITKYAARAKSTWSDLGSKHIDPRVRAHLVSLGRLAKQNTRSLSTVLETRTEELTLEGAVSHLLSVKQRQHKDKAAVQVYTAREGKRAP